MNIEQKKELFVKTKEKLGIKEKTPHEKLEDEKMKIMDELDEEAYTAKYFDLVRTDSLPLFNSLPLQVTEGGTVFTWLNGFFTHSVLKQYAFLDLPETREINNNPWKDLVACVEYLNALTAGNEEISQQEVWEQICLLHKVIKVATIANSVHSKKRFLKQFTSEDVFAFTPEDFWKKLVIKKVS